MWRIKYNTWLNEIIHWFSAAFLPFPTKLFAGPAKFFPFNGNCIEVEAENKDMNGGHLHIYFYILLGRSKIVRIWALWGSYIKVLDGVAFFRRVQCSVFVNCCYPVTSWSIPRITKRIHKRLASETW